jgi:hypothetical protein
MVKKSNYGKIGGVVAVLVFATMVVLALFDSHGFFDDLKTLPPVDEPPLAVRRPLTVEDCVVSVSALYKDYRRSGQGVLVEVDGETFVLTSSMILIDDFESISLEFGVKGNWTVRGELIEKNDDLGLASITCEPGFNVGYPISDAPNLPPDAESTALSSMGPAKVQTLGYLHASWLLITGINDDYIGAPLVNGDDITGIVVGLNQANTTEAIVITAQGIREFVQ